MKSILMSIKPKWCELIASGKKTIEVRKTRPKIDTPFMVYIYETQGDTDTPFVDEDGHVIFKGRGLVIGEFVCDKIEQYDFLHTILNVAYCVSDNSDNRFLSYKSAPLDKMCLTQEELLAYGKGKPLYGWHIDDLIVYDEPKPITEYGLKRAPESWGYVEV